MVMALHQQGWRVVLDVVYNHTFAAGPSSRHSVLDKLVPGYYHRRMEDGEMCHSTCCNNGWRVVLDVVYNHTFAAGPSSRHSVLDKLVPGYYHRRMEDGE
ncbi:Aamy domain-containing protein, partial [Haematococcus lacustris]